MVRSSIGAVGLIQRVVKSTEEFFLFVHGVCRLKLIETSSELPFEIGKIDVIANYTELIGEFFVFNY